MKRNIKKILSTYTYVFIPNEDVFCNFFAFMAYYGYGYGMGYGDRILKLLYFSNLSNGTGNNTTNTFSDSNQKNMFRSQTLSTCTASYDVASSKRNLSQPSILLVLVQH